MHVRARGRRSSSTAAIPPSRGRCASAEDLSEVLPDIDVPTLLVYGDDDVRAPLAVAEDLRAAISGSTLVVLADTGHLCNIEAPEAFNDAVRSFLRGTRD